MDPTPQASIEPLSLDATLHVRTPERVRLSLPVAGVGTRALAWLVDAGILFFGWAALFFLVSLTETDLIGTFEGLSGPARTLLLLGTFAAQWVYWTLFEVLWGGRTPGKALLRIRVARLDGSAPGVIESAIRNLLRVVDFLPFGYCVGLLSALFTDQHRRLGDLAAGTLMLRDEQIRLDHYLEPEAAPSSRIAPATAAAAALEGPVGTLLTSYLARVDDFTPEARVALARSFLEKLGDSLEPAEREALEADPAALVAWLRDLSNSVPVMARPVS